MTRHYIEVIVQMHLTRERMEQLTETLVDAVFELSGVIDPDLAVDYRELQFEFNMAVDAEDSPDALRTALSAVRTALHQVGEPTPGWDDLFRIIKETILPEPFPAEASAQEGNSLEYA